jgi:quercetin dioxygenase-like cupin family protein
LVTAIAVICISFLLAGIAFGQSVPLPEGTIQLPDGNAEWIDGPPSLPAGTKIQLLEGNPAGEGFFTMRVKAPAGSRLQPHWHPREERVTILTGLVRVGFGDAFVEGNMTTFGPGSYYVNPAMSHHYVWILEETVMQLSGTGPWEIHLLADGDHTGDDHR